MKYGLAIICAAFMCFCATSAYASNRYDLQYKAIAKIILQLPRYTKGLPEDPTICIGANDRFYTLLGELNEEKRAFSRIENGIVNNGFGGCNLAYADQVNLGRRIVKSNMQGLTIANYSSFIDEGGAIAIVDVQGRMEIQLNLTAAKKQGLSFSPDLIELSERVVQ